MTQLEGVSFHEHRILSTQLVTWWVAYSLVNGIHRSRHWQESQCAPLYNVGSVLLSRSPMQSLTVNFRS